MTCVTTLSFVCTMHFSDIRNARLLYNIPISYCRILLVVLICFRQGSRNDLKTSHFLTLSPEIKSYARSVIWHFLPPVDLFDTVWISFKYEIMAPQRTLLSGAGETMRVCKAPGNLRY